MTYKEIIQKAKEYGFEASFTNSISDDFIELRLKKDGFVISNRISKQVIESCFADNLAIMFEEMLQQMFKQKNGGCTK